jgi:predicted DNA-binding protein with PD1-like motif
MNYTRFGNVLVLKLDRGEEILESVEQMARQEKFRLANVNALGAVAELSVSTFIVGANQFKPHEFKGDFEIVSLTGTIKLMDGNYHSHLHVSVADQEGRVFGGHLNRAVISILCEMVIYIIE